MGADGGNRPGEAPIRLSIVAVGRARGSEEERLVADYLARAAAAGRALGFSDARLIEVEDKKRRGAAEEGRLALAAAEGDLIVALDERGRALSSREFAGRLANWRDQGRRGAAFLIGGADGHGAEVRAQADFTLSFGPMVWPHMLARVMLAEQIYRGVSILAGAPYHRD